MSNQIAADRRLRRLSAYLAASVGALGVTAQGESAIIYTPGPFVANNSTIAIDFDGQNDPEFTISHSTGSETKKSKTVSFNRLSLAPGPGFNGWVAQGTATSPLAVKPARLASGVNVSTAGPLSVGKFPVTSNLAGDKTTADWNGGQTGFIGVTFDLGGGPVFGWIELQTPADGLSLNTGQVLGYAYEDSGAPIRTGQTETVVPEPSSMLLLASGAAGVLALRRRRKKAQS